MRPVFNRPLRFAQRVESLRAALAEATEETREDLEWALEDGEFAIEEAMAGIEEGMTTPLLDRALLSPIWFSRGHVGHRQ